jgi:hypothetical protein
MVDRHPTLKVRLFLVTDEVLAGKLISLLHKALQDPVMQIVGSRETDSWFAPQEFGPHDVSHQTLYQRDLPRLAFHRHQNVRKNVFEAQ